MDCLPGFDAKLIAAVRRALENSDPDLMRLAADLLNRKALLVEELAAATSDSGE